jgi:hypothetical protein
MQARRQADKPTSRQGSRIPIFCLPVSLSGCVLLCVAMGCESFGSRLRNDPFYGVQNAAAPVPAPNPPGDAPQAQASANRVPPLPASISAPGTVPMASGESATPEKGSGLRMANDPVSPVSMSSTGAARGLAPVTVGKPEPAPIGTTANLTTPAAESGGLGAPTPAPPAAGSTASSIRTFDDAQRWLKQKGVNWQYLSGEENQWKFQCGIPNPSTPNVNKTYQTDKPFPDPLSAMLAIIAEIDKAPR